MLTFYGYLYTQYEDYERALAAAPAMITMHVTLAHLYFTRQQHQLALDTAARYLRGIEKQTGRTDQRAQHFVDKLQQLGLTPAVQ